MRGVPGPLWALRIVQMEEYVARNSADSIAFNCRRLDVCLGRRVGRGISVIIRVLLGNGAIDLDRRGMLSGHGHGDVSGSHAAGGREYAVRPASQVQGGLARCVRRGRLPAARLVRQRDVRAGRPGLPLPGLAGPPWRAIRTVTVAVEAGEPTPSALQTRAGEGERRKHGCAAQRHAGRSPQLQHPPRRVHLSDLRVSIQWMRRGATRVAFRAHAADSVRCAIRQPHRRCGRVGCGVGRRV
jgi:hypothetical protein